MLVPTPLVGALLCVAGLTHGRSLMRSTEQEQQLFPSSEGHGQNAPLTITVQSEVSLSRPAEIGKMHLTVSASGMSEDAARQEAAVSMGLVDNAINQLSPHNDDSGIEKWTTTPIQVRSKRQDYGRDSGFWADDEDLMMTSDLTSGYAASSRYTITFRNVDALQTFGKDLIALSQVKIDYVDWELTDTSAEAQKAEVRRKAIRKVIEAGEDYAKAFGVAGVKPVEFEEDYSYTTTGGWRHGYWYDGEDADLQQPDIETSTTVRCKFSVV